MRPPLVVAPIALIVCAAAALAGTTSTTTTNTTTHLITPVQAVAVCHPATDMGNIVVAIPGSPAFKADSIDFTNHAAIMDAGTMQAKQTEGRVEHGEVSITKQVDSASPKLSQALRNIRPITTMSITMRKAGGDYVVVSLGQTAVRDIAVSSPVPGHAAQETVKFSYESMSECTGPAKAR